MNLREFPWRRLFVALLLVVLAISLASGPAAGQKRYIAVDSSNSDAVLLDEPEGIFGNPVGRLRFNQEVEVTGRARGGYTPVRARVGGRSVEGWVRSGVLSEREVTSGGVVSEAAGAEISAQAARGLTREIEDEMRGESKEMDAALALVTRIEEARALALGGDANDPDPVRVRQRLRRFAEEGGLQRR